MLRLVSWLLVLLSTGIAQAADRPIRPIGEFSNMRFTEEHAYGYSVQLWRDGNSVIGLFLASAGLQGDTPTGLLENVKFNPRTGALSFTAKLTMGAAVLPGGGQAPSRDLFEFSGILKTATLIGTLKHSGDAARIQLSLRQQSTMLTAASYAEWKRQADEVLRYRGPKW